VENGGWKLVGENTWVKIGGWKWTSAIMFWRVWERALVKVVCKNWWIWRMNCFAFRLRCPVDIMFFVIIKRKHPISKRFLAFLFLGHVVSDVSEVVTTLPIYFFAREFYSDLIRRFCVGGNRLVEKGGWKLVGENAWVEIGGRNQTGEFEWVFYRVWERVSLKVVGKNWWLQICGWCLHVQGRDMQGNISKLGVYAQ